MHTWRHTDTDSQDKYLPRLHGDPRLLLHLVDLLPDLRELRPDAFEVLQFFQGHLSVSTVKQ